MILSRALPTNVAVLSAIRDPTFVDVDHSYVTQTQTLVCLEQIVLSLPQVANYFVNLAKDVAGGVERPPQAGDSSLHRSSNRVTRGSSFGRREGQGRPSAQHPCLQTRFAEAHRLDAAEQVECAH
jgi:hypothetical protein